MGGRRRVVVPPVLLAAPLLAASGFLPGPSSTLVALAAIIVLGVPHGALDGEIARDVVRPRFGRLWFPVFAAPYLALSAMVLAAWHLFPLATLAGFLAASSGTSARRTAAPAPGSSNWRGADCRSGFPPCCSRPRRPGFSRRSPAPPCPRCRPG